MDRRAFLGTLAGSILAAPLAAEAQQTGKVYRIGLLVPGQPPGCGSESPPPALLALGEGLREFGHVEGQTYVLVARCAVREGQEIQRAADEIVGEKVDVVIVASNELARAMKNATSIVPVVFFAVNDPEEEGLVASLARPGGNLTGFSHQTGELAGKRLQLLKDTVPNLRKVAILSPQKNRQTERECVRLGFDVQLFAAPDPGAIDAAFAAMRRARPDGLLVVPHPMFWVERRHVVTQAAEIGVPAIYETKDFVTSGGLMAYGASLVDMSRRAAAYVDKILKGSKPADLPVEQPTKFDLVINLKTAKALGLTIPQSLLQRADQVIE
jgi:putative ABC transport system substrate-binding protein